MYPKIVNVKSLCLIKYHRTSALNEGEWTASIPGHFTSTVNLDAVVQRKKSISCSDRESNPNHPVCSLFSINTKNYIMKNPSKLTQQLYVCLSSTKDLKGH